MRPHEVVRVLNTRRPGGEKELARLRKIRKSEKVKLDGMIVCEVLRNDPMRGQMDLVGCGVKDYERIELHVEDNEESPAQQMGKKKRGKIGFFTIFINTYKTWT